MGRLGSQSEANSLPSEESRERHAVTRRLATLAHAELAIRTARSSTAPSMLIDAAIDSQGVTLPARRLQPGISFTAVLFGLSISR